MRVLGFCEGGRLKSGRSGIPGVVGIHRAFAKRGHPNAVAIGGQAMPSARPILRRRLEDVFNASEEAVAGAVSFQAFGRWCFAPSLYRAAHEVAGRADFIALHSVFSYPVFI